MSSQNTRPSLFLHIGIHKTGSTFLQKEVFPNLPNIKFWHRPSFNIVGGENPTSLSRFMDGSPLIWRDLGDVLWNKLTREVPVHSDILISDEHPVQANDPLRIEQHLREVKKLVGPSHNLHILIVIRRQDTWFASAYAEMSNRYNGASQDHFEEWLQHYINFEKSFFDSAGVRLRYFTLIQKIQDAVGQDSVTVLPYELLKSNPRLFVNQCCNAVNREVPDSISLKPKNKRCTSDGEWSIRPRYNYIQLRPGRAFQAVFGKSRIPIPDWRRGKKITLNKSLSSLILEKYSSENEKLDQNLNLGLKKYGYY